MNTLRAAISVLVFAVALSKTGGAAERQFDYDSQLGVVELGERICLTIPNDKLSAGDVVHLILPEESQLHIEATITGRSPKSCSSNPATRPTDSFYVLQGKGQKFEVPAIALGIVNYKSTFKLQDDLWGFNPHNDASWEFLRACTSGEGLHLSVWRGRPLKGMRIWHWYYYLGYDVEADCTDADFEDTLPK
jgi:hypothetical protein